MNDSENRRKKTAQTTGNKTFTVNNAWQSLRRFTDARIGMGRSGISQPTANQLAFQLDHARAQDAVKKPLDWSAIEHPLRSLGLPILKLDSRATDRETYLQRPDLGRLLSRESEIALEQWQLRHGGAVDICLGIADGLSTPALEQQAPEMVRQFIRDLESSNHRCSVICLVRQGRVAISDEIASRLNAPYTALLIGERPGLSSPNSLGIYFTYRAQPGFTDARRNCISNIRPQGLSFKQASKNLLWLIEEAERLGLSGVHLKDTRPGGTPIVDQGKSVSKNFLVPSTGLKNPAPIDKK